MEKATKDRALMKALAQKEPRQLPSNFAYVTMQRIKEEQRAEKRRQHKLAIITVIAVTLVGIATLLYLLGDVIWQSLLSISFHVCLFMRMIKLYYKIILLSMRVLNLNMMLN